MPKLLAPGAVPEAAPIDDDALLARATEYTLPSGRRILWLAPDEMEMLAFTGTLPDPITASVYLLLRDEGALTEEDDPASYQRELQHIKATYAICKAGMVKPKFNPDLAIGDGENVLGRRDLSRGDRNYIYNWPFLVGATPEIFAAANRDRLRGVAKPTPDSESLRSDASGADQPESAAD